MSTELQKKYGLATAIAMVVGIVIGSGVFFKAERVLSATGGNLPLGILAWVLGGCIMLTCAYVFSIMATKYEKVNGIVDYAEVALGDKYGYYIGWFMATIYYPTLASALAWISARYTCVIFGLPITGGEAMTIACFYLIMSYAINTLSPILAGKFQVGTTVIKLIPLLLMAIVGTIVGLKNGILLENFTVVANVDIDKGTALFTALVSTAFAYEGWIVATSINSELKDAKKNLPIALLVGSVIVVLAYVLYYIGLAGSVTNQVLMENGENGVKIAFGTVFGKFGGIALSVFVVISCLGTLNGLMLGCSRGIYSLAARNQGPKVAIFKQVDSKTDMPTNSSVIGLLFCAGWLLYFYGTQLTDSWLGQYIFDPTELPIITLYGAYIPIFFMLIKREKDLSIFKRVIMPSLGILACIFIIFAACVAHKMQVVWYLVTFAIIMIIGAVLKNSSNSKNA